MAQDWTDLPSPYGPVGLSICRLVVEIELPDEFTWERFCEAPVVQAALDAVPDPVHGLLLHRGRGGSAGSRYPRRPRPFTGAGSAELPLPEEEVEGPIVCPSAILMG